MNPSDVWEARLSRSEREPAPEAVTLSYLACGKRKFAVIAPISHPAKAIPPAKVGFIPYGTKIIQRGLTATGAERVATRANAVVLAIQRLG